MLVRYADSAQVSALSPLMAQYPVDWIDTQWSTHNGSLEEIIRLNPDLILAGEYNATLLRERLKASGFRVEILVLPTSLSELDHYQQRFLQLIGKQNLLHATTRPPSPDTKRDHPKVLLLGANGVGTGRNTLENEILEYSGWDNYLMEEGYISLDLERLVLKPPDYLLWSAPKSAALANQFAQHPVLKRQIPKNRWLTTDYWYWQCPGPWTWELIEQLRQWKKD
jgi:iron complex transport system substrate-binding protein